MNSLAKIFLSLLILVLVVVGFLFSVVKVLKIYPEKENLSLEKQISSKPKDINEKQASVEFGINYQEEFTFFDILDDPSMRKFIGLNGDVVELQESAHGKSIDLDSQIDKSLDSQFINPAAKKTLNFVVPHPGVQKQGDSSLPGFALQVGSFQKSQRANVLKNKLINKDYPVFIISTWVAEQEQTLYRVFVGRFPKKIDAEKIAMKIKETEKIDPLIKWQEGEALEVSP